MKTYLTTTFLIVFYSFAFANENTPVLNTNNFLLSHKVLFNTVSHTITKQPFVAYLVANKETYFTIQGRVCFTKGGPDSKDKKPGKKKLSQVRTKFIHDYLVKDGVNKSRIKSKGLNGAHKLGGNDKDNRRVKLFIRAIK